MPATTVRSVDSRPSIAIKGASPAAELLVDGLNMGKAQTVQWRTANTDT